MNHATDLIAQLHRLGCPHTANARTLQILLDAPDTRPALLRLHTALGARRFPALHEREYPASGILAEFSLWASIP